MIGQGRDAGLGQRISGVLDLGARQTIDDACVSGVALADERLELGWGILLFDDLITNIRAVETLDEAWRKALRTRDPHAIVLRSGEMCDFLIQCPAESDATAGANGGGDSS